MFTDPVLMISDRRPRVWANRSARAEPRVSAESRKQAPAVSPKKAPRRPTSAPPAPSLPEGWQRRLREQSNNVARALEMLEQAAAMMNEPRAHALARAECLRGAGLITLLAAAELLVIAGWFEADQAVTGGSVTP